MKSRAIRVVRERGEEVRQLLRERGLLRPDLRVIREASTLLFALTPEGPVPDGIGDLVEAEFPPIATRGAQDYRDLLSGSGIARETLPRSFDVVGDIVLVRLPSELESRGAEIGAALLEFVPGARLVGQDRGVEGPERRRSVECLAGTGGWTTRHRENGLELEVDLQRAYFSPRLAREHARVAAEVRVGDRVYDLCCGVGPFSVTIARDGRASQVIAVDANPAAIHLLRTTLARYTFARTVEPVEQDLDQFLAGRTPFERVVFNLPHEGIKYLPSVGTVVSRAGRLFYYEVVDRDTFEHRSDQLLATLGSPGEWRRVGLRVVHPYAPTSDLVSFTFERAAA
ncbi:MAG: methyltransferase [Thermoplasmata archaeon]|nr:methyltransferase [Thermoplasmata archaeon]